MGAIREAGFFLNQQHLGPWGPPLTPGSLPGGVNPSPVMGNFSPSLAELTHLQTSLPPCSSILSLNLDANPSFPALQHFGSGLYGALTSLAVPFSGKAERACVPGEQWFLLETSLVQLGETQTTVGSEPLHGKGSGAV